MCNGFVPLLQSNVSRDLKAASIGCFQVSPPTSSRKLFKASTVFSSRFSSRSTLTPLSTSPVSTSPSFPPEGSAPAAVHSLPSPFPSLCLSSPSSLYPLLPSPLAIPLVLGCLSFRNLSRAIILTLLSLADSPILSHNLFNSP